MKHEDDVNRGKTNFYLHMITLPISYENRIN